MVYTVKSQKAFIEKNDGSGRVYLPWDGVGPVDFTGLIAGDNYDIGYEIVWDANVVVQAAIPSLRAAGTPVVFTTQPARTLTFPTYQAGDVMVVVLAQSGSNTPPDLSNFYGAGDGFTLVQSGGSSSSSYRKPTIYCRKMTGAEGVSMLFPFTTPTTTKFLNAWSFKDCAAGTPWQAIGTGASGTAAGVSKNGGTLNQGKNRVFVVSAFAQTANTGNAFSSPLTNPDLVNPSQLLQFNDPAQAMGVYILQGERAASGAIAATTGTLGTLFNHSEAAIALFGA